MVIDEYVASIESGRAIFCRSIPGPEFSTLAVYATSLLDEGGASGSEHKRASISCIVEGSKNVVSGIITVSVSE